MALETILRDMRMDLTDEIKSILGCILTNEEPSGPPIRSLRRSLKWKLEDIFDPLEDQLFERFDNT